MKAVCSLTVLPLLVISPSSLSSLFSQSIFSDVALVSMTSTIVCLSTLRLRPVVSALVPTSSATRSVRSMASIASVSNSFYSIRNDESNVAKRRLRQMLPMAIRSTGGSTSNNDDLTAQILLKGNEIRALKESGADKLTVAPLIEELLSLKAKVEPPVTKTQQHANKSTVSETLPCNANTKSGNIDEGDTEAESKSSDYITSRKENYSKWYNSIISVTGLAESSPVRGCMVIKPWGMALWDIIRLDLDARIKLHGAENAYFPLLIPKSFLAKEAQHVDGFAKECAVVTHHRLTINPENNELIVDPEAKLEDPLIIRPTSETVIWNMFHNWIQSYRDLPLKLNQWANVVRWEMRTRPFLRTSEFLWQEGHTAHATAEEAIQDAQAMLDQYAELCRDLLAIPVIKGVKSPSERFAGALETYTIEALMQNGWSLQSGTSHFLGQSFGKAFDVTFQDESGKRQDVWGTSWGVSTRLLGALIMTHSDDAGLVLPPRVAPIQVVVVPIIPTNGKKNKNAGEDEGALALNKCVDELVADLKTAGLRVKVDDRDYVRNGAKYFEWERKGVPLRIELGPRDLKNGVCIFKYRVGQKEDEKLMVELGKAGEAAKDGLNRLQSDLLSAASERLTFGIRRGVSYDEMKNLLACDEASIYPGAGLFLVPWKCDAANEEKIKDECKATIRCYPLDENYEDMVKGKVCFYSGEPATHIALFGRAF